MKKFLFLMVAALLTAGGKTMAQTVKSASVPTGYGGNVTISYKVLSETDKTCSLVAQDQADAKGTVPYTFGGDIDLPSEIDGYTVTGIERYAFTNTRCRIAKLPEHLEYIKNFAFVSQSEANSKPVFTDVLQIPATMTAIQSQSFANSRVNKVVLPGSVTAIQVSAFSGSTLSAIELSEGLTTIGDFAFKDTKITEVKLPSTLTEIYSNAFYQTALTEINLPDGLTKIGTAAFYKTGISKIKLPDALQTIGGNAFAYTNIDTLNIPANVTSIGEGLTQGCNNLSVIKVDAANTTYSDMNCNVIYDATTNTLVAGCKNSAIPSSTVKIGMWAFTDISAFSKQLYFYSDLTTIGAGAFQGTSIKHLLIPENVTSIENSAFEYCDSLERVDIYGDGHNLKLGIKAFHLSPGVDTKLAIHIHHQYPPRTTLASSFVGMEKVTLYVPSVQWYNQTFYSDDTKAMSSFFANVKTYTVVNRVDITDYEWPTAGKVGDYDVTSTTTGVKNVAVKYIMFSKVLDMHDEKFAPSESWLVRMDIFLDNGYVFGLPQTYIDGKVQDIRITRSGRDDEQHFGWQATPIIPAGGVPVESLSCELPAPVVGEVPADYITYPNPSGRYFARTYFGKYGGQITWTPLHVSFREDVVYTAKIKVSCGEDYTFSEDLVPTVNGKSAQLIRGETDATGRCHEATISYTFHITKATPDGDVDGNGLLNSADVVSVYNYIIDGDASGVDKTAANVDGDTDGSVNSADVVAIYNYIIDGANYQCSYDGIEIPMVNVEGGPFIMGSPDEDSDSYDYEKPQHRVTLSPFAIGATEVTQKLWTAVMGSNPSYFEGEDNPVEMVSWDDCQKFIKKLNEDFGDKLGDKQFRLPTEAEWEYAARGGQQSKEYKYIGGDDPDEVAWYDTNGNYETHPVAQKKPNELGIYDMAGNVWEWCWDWYGDYPSTSQTDPTGPATESQKVARGGSYINPALRFRPSNRGASLPSYPYNYLGLRLVLSNIILSEE